ncbi:MAG TPA: sulfurtransferase [Thermomicrobiaceae bacterium]|nr:sulfurtransferase [Thermomicrobiaceae bacterium]
MAERQASGYANPQLLVSTDWVQQHLNDPQVRVVESDEDPLLYDLWHVPGAVTIDWHTDLQTPSSRDFIDQPQFAELLGRLGIANDTTVVFYGDKNNWWAAYAYWFFKYMGHQDCRIMDGGRKKWEAEKRPTSREAPTYARTNYQPGEMRTELRAYRDDVLTHIGYEGRHRVGNGRPLVDVRSPQEYSGELLHMPDYPQEGALRGGHIPGAVNIPWGRAVNEDGTIKPAEELRQLYQPQGVVPNEEVITYCRIGERSAHTWYVLHELLGYPNVRNYDGSWTEWGNIVGFPIEQ